MKKRTHSTTYRRMCMILDIITLAAMAVLVYMLLSSHPDTNYDPDRSVYPVKGIDVSAHNGDIDFEAVASDSVSFVLIKATEGTDFCDAKFNVNYRNACTFGLKVAPYHFFRFDKPGDVQAYHFLGSIDRRSFDMPLAIDVEKWGNPQKYDIAEVKANLHLMVDIIRQLGYPVILYTNKSGYSNFIKGGFDDIPVWICSLSGPPAIDGWVMWQHSHRGKVDGVAGSVDIDTYRGDYRAFDAWTVPYTVELPESLLPDMQ